MFHGKQEPPRGLRPRNSFVPSSRSSQRNGLCPKTLLVSLRLGGGAATGDLVTDHQEGERERGAKQTVRLRVCGPDVPAQSGLSIEGRNITRAPPVIGQLDDRLRLSPQRLRGHKAIEIKRVFPREPGVPGAAELVRQHGERFGFAVFTFQFGKVLLARLVVP